ncbi:hypothetical protein DSO57_1006565 [Entomophthora muscae]|uniref:Uncharacterized protein n=1 Tax=Entomophthora muscae TaxID=34485 RepID=A0ACC2TV55_9FUNG|nr:hypothetical protein DSO57_1006565 [Entomophthora muscae]
MLWLLLLVSASCTLVELDRATSHCDGIDLREITIQALHDHYLTGRLTVQKVTECYLNRIHALNPTLNAVISTNPNAHLDAIKLDLKMRRGEWGSLYGIPILVKDNIAVDGMQTTAGTLFLRDIFPKKEAIVVQRLRKHGAIILGKTNLSELSGLLQADAKQGFSFAGEQTKNPYNLTSDIFGSSSGSAAAVAANLAMGALGTETVGSIISPASTTALYGFKPSHTPTLNKGLVPLSKLFDTVGVIARTALDTAILAKALTSKARLENNRTDFEGIRIGVLETYFENPHVKPHLNLTNESLINLENIGVKIVKTTYFYMPPAYTYSVLTDIICGFGPNIQKYLKRDTSRLISANPKIKDLKSIVRWYKNHPCSRNYTLDLLIPTLNCSANPNHSLRKLQYEMQHNLTEFFAQNRYYAILVPSHPRPMGYVAALVAGYPVINLPVGFTKDGSSVGAALFGPANSDSLLLNLAMAFDAQTPSRLPPKFLN